MTNPQGVAVDMGDASPQAVGPNGQPTQRMYQATVEGTEAEFLRAAKDARINGDEVFAQKLEEKIGKKVDVSVFAKHPVLTGVTIGMLSTVTVGTGIYLGRRWYKNRQAAKLQPPSRSRIRAVG
jgi:hypothetical protein